MLKATASILALAAIGAPCTGFAQPPSALRPNGQDQAQIVSKIREIQSRDGPFSATLIDPWVSLSLAYQEDGDQSRAAAAIEEARGLIRANYGLNTVREARLLWQEVRNEKAGGDAEAAWYLEQKLLTMVRRHPDDLGVVPILRGIADERMDILSRYRAGKAPPQIIIGCYYDRYKHPPGNQSRRHCLGGSRDDVLRALLAEARTYYKKAIGVLYRHQRYSSMELHELEASLVRASYLDYTQTRHTPHFPLLGVDARAGAAADYRTGRQSYRRLISYGAATSAPWLARVKTFVKMTDWDLLFSQRAGTASLDDVVHAYERAHRSLEHKTVAKASIDEIFSPKMPVVLPAFLPNPLLSKRTPDSSGHIDVAFYITKYGRSEHIEILDTTTNATRAKRKELVHLIGRCLFRPRISDGGVDDSSRVVLRYYLNNQASVARACRYSLPLWDTHPPLGSHIRGISKSQP